MGHLLSVYTKTRREILARDLENTSGWWHTKYNANS